MECSRYGWWKASYQPPTEAEYNGLQTSLQQAAVDRAENAEGRLTTAEDLLTAERQAHETTMAGLLATERQAHETAMASLAESQRTALEKGAERPPGGRDQVGLLGGGTRGAEEGFGAGSDPEGAGGAVVAASLVATTPLAA